MVARSRLQPFLFYATVSVPCNGHVSKFTWLKNGYVEKDTLGKLLGCTEQAVAKWEKTGKVPKTSDLAVRMIYKQADDGKEGVGAHAFPPICAPLFSRRQLPTIQTDNFPATWVPAARTTAKTFNT